MEPTTREALKNLRLRLPPDLHEQLSEQAWRERRSMNDLVMELVRRHVAERSAAGA
jgi:predicted HicB family RNase H-like nuclease